MLGVIIQRGRLASVSKQRCNMSLIKSSFQAMKPLRSIKSVPEVSTHFSWTLRDGKSSLVENPARVNWA